MRIISFKTILALGVVITLVTSLFPDSYLGDCLGNFPILWIVVLLIGLLGSLQHHFGISFLAATLGIYLNVARIRDAIQLNQRESVHRQCPEIKIASYNLLAPNHGYEFVQKELEEQDPDVILFQEFTQKWEEGLDSILVKFPHNIVDFREDLFGSGIFSKLPVLRKAKQSLVPGDAGVLTATISHCGHSVSVANIHAVPPVSTRNWLVRNQQIMKVAEIVKSNEQWIVMGDFNMTPFSCFYKQFRAATGLNDARTVLGLSPTWPTWVPPLWIPIDQVFHSSDLEMVDIRHGKFNGSDHWPIIAVFR